MEQCKERCTLLTRNQEDAFVKMIIQMLGPVLFGEKPAEIISFPQKDEAGLNRIKQIFSNCPKVVYREFIAFNGIKKILFFNNLLLKNTLSDKRNIAFLSKMGYKEEYDVNSYIDHLIDKIEKDNLPHEIGVFLGYPLKDVIGFMGHPALKLTKINGWNVYGDTRLSDEKYSKFTTAKQIVQKMLEEISPEAVVSIAS